LHELVYVVPHPQTGLEVLEQVAGFARQSPMTFGPGQDPGSQTATIRGAGARVGPPQSVRRESSSCVESTLSDGSGPALHPPTAPAKSNPKEETPNRPKEYDFCVLICEPSTFAR
jgi:hypothetical protein